MNARDHPKRPSSHALKQLGSNARPARPVMGTKRSSYRQTLQHSSSNPPSPGLRRSSRKQSSDEDDDNMASFLQFCMTCETQIASPNPSLLYCSEACRKRDIRQSSSYTHSPTLSPQIRPATDHHLPDIIPQRSPTILRPLSELSLSSLTSSLWSDDDDIEATSPGVQDLPGWPSPVINFEHPKRYSLAGTEGVPSLINSPASSYGTVTVSSVPTSSRPLGPRRAGTTAKSMDLVTCTLAATTRPSSSQRLKSQASTVASARTVEASRRPADMRDTPVLARRRQSTAAGSLERLSYATSRGVP